MRWDRLTADDRIVLWMDRTWAQDVGMVAVLEGAPLLDADGALRLDEVRAALARRLRRLPRLRQVLLTPPRLLGRPLWVDDPAFDLRDHVRQCRVTAPGGYAELLATVEGLRRERLDVSRPLWEVWLLPGLAQDRVGLFVRLHHVVADGVAGLATLRFLLDPDDGREEPDDEGAAWVPGPWPTRRQLWLDHLRTTLATVPRTTRSLWPLSRPLRTWRTAWPATRELLTGPPGPSTSLDGVVGPDRVLAAAHADLADVSDVARLHGATVNDVLLAMVAGGLRALLVARGEDVDGLEIPVFVPVSLRRGQQDQPVGNEIGQIIVRLPVGPSDPQQLLRQVSAAMTERKALARPTLGATFRGRLLSRYVLKMVVRQRVNVTTADLVGPPSRWRLAGAQVREMYPLVNLLGNVTLGVGALSYAGRFDLLVVGDAVLHPDVGVFASGASEELRALGRSSSGQPTAS